MPLAVGVDLFTLHRAYLISGPIPRGLYLVSVCTRMKCLNAQSRLELLRLFILVRR